MNRWQKKSKKAVSKEKLLKRDLGMVESTKVTFGSDDEEKDEIDTTTISTGVSTVNQLNIDDVKETLTTMNSSDKLSYKERRKERKRLAKLKKKESSKQDTLGGDDEFEVKLGLDDDQSANGSDDGDKIVETDEQLGLELTTEEKLEKLEDVDINDLEAMAANALFK